MDRLHFTDWSLELPDGEFVAALGAVGVLAAYGQDRVDKSLGQARGGARAGEGVESQHAGSPTGAPQSGSDEAHLVAIFEAAWREGDGLLAWRAPVASRARRPARPSTTPPTTLRRTRAGDARVRRLEGLPDARTLARCWRNFLAGLPPPPIRSGHAPVRLAVQSTGFGVDTACARLLARPEGGVASVHLADIFDSDGRTDWHWPFTIAVLAGDPLAPALSAQQRALPQPWPFRFAVAGRNVARVEVLVVAAPLAQALARLLVEGIRLRCCLVVVAGLGDDSPASAEPLLRALVARLSAEGAVVIGAGSTHANGEASAVSRFVAALDAFGRELAHDAPLDLALSLAFEGCGFGAPLMLLNRDLLGISRLGAALDDLADRLRELPAGARVSASARTFDRLRLPAEETGTDETSGAAPPAGPGFEARHAPEPAVAPPAASASPSARPEIRTASAGAAADAIATRRDKFRFDDESGEAAVLSELATSVREQQRSAADRHGIRRFVQQSSHRRAAGRFVAERRGYVVGEPVRVDVFIGPKTADSIAAPTAFPEHELPRQREPHRLQLVFHEPRQFDEPMLGEIELPAAGNSTAARFVFTPRQPGRFEARLSIVHRNRVLQTVLMRALVAASDDERKSAQAGISLHDEAQVRRDWSDLDSRRPFDLALVLNHTVAGDALLTAIKGPQAWATDLAGIEQPVRRINELLSGVAYSVEDYGDGLDKGENPKLLTKLARVGADLHSRLYRDQFRALATPGFDVGDDSVTHVQVVSTRADAVVPLEFLYDYAAPNPDAQVCPGHREALKAGRCPANCARVEKPREYVCPMGFWGLKKVVERHVFDARDVVPAGAGVLLRGDAAESVAGRDRLELRAGALVGHSQEVTKKNLGRLLTLLEKQLACTVPVARDWNEWQQTVISSRPAMLVAFPHNEGSEEDVLLEIGGGKLYTLGLPPEYVRPGDGPPPIVFLLGCDVAGTAQQWSNHIRFFRQAGAAIVVSTIATVFGPHAVRVGEAILAHLLRAGAQDEPVRLGEALREARRRALLDSVPMALCVVAFGDADWRL